MLPGFLEQRLSIAGMFAVFAAITVLFLGVVVPLVPETSGKNYQDFILDQAHNRTFSLWLPNLKNQPMKENKKTKKNLVELLRFETKH